MISAHIQTTTNSLETVTARFCISNPRESRLLKALSQCNGLMREQLDRAIGASNTPDVVFRLRNRGWDLPCERQPVIDRDGIECRVGFYSFSEDDRTRYANSGMKDEVHHVVG